MANLISFVMDNNGNILGNSGNYFPFFKFALSKLNLKFNQKKLLANMFEKNYTVCKLPLELNGAFLNQYIFEEWRIDNNTPLTLTKNLFINKELKNAQNFSDFEQELIYSLLSGYIVDKEIEKFLCQITCNKIKGNVRYTISSLYEKFSCDNRTDLVELLKAHELNGNLPKTIFPTGEYLV